MTMQSSVVHAELFEPMREAVAEAGRLAHSMFRNNVRSWNKENQSPVSEADLAVDAFLRERLTALNPAIGWLSEETADAPERLARDLIWIVDPIDGTRSFVAGREDWAVCAALVQKGRPIAAAVELPATGESFAAVAGGGATRNGSPIAASRRAEISNANVARPAMLNAAAERAGMAIAPARIHSIAVRLSRVATGELDGALAGRNAHDWDLAAPDLLVHEAGGKMTDAAGLVPVYNRATPIHGALIAAGSELHPLLVSALAASLK
jgi:myo-inositol-1(or 4)-monophosphatase